MDAAKVQAITEMPWPIDVAGVHREMAQYLAKFLPHLIPSQVPAPPVRPNQATPGADSEGCCMGVGKEKALENLNKVTTPILRY